jgi:protein gp37
MGEKSKIEWTDATWNPVRGCTKINPGCQRCYAETFAERFRGISGHAFEYGFDLRLVHENLNAPARWARPRRILVNSMSDLFHEKVPDEFIESVCKVMLRANSATATSQAKRTRMPLSASPLSSVVHVSPTATGNARVRVPVVMISPAASAGLI